jgi:RimJ/RimL family protein N-acetyltransferase
MLSLRTANRQDEELVLRLRNDPATRRASFSSAEVSAEEHHAWFSRRLEDPDCALLIVEEDGRAVGQVRLDRSRLRTAEISIGLAPGARGRGVGREALRLAVTQASELLGVSVVRALIKRDNVPSLAAFAAAGFRVVVEDEDVVELLYELEVDASPG